MGAWTRRCYARLAPEIARSNSRNECYMQWCYYRRAEVSAATDAATEERKWTPCSKGVCVHSIHVVGRMLHADSRSRTRIPGTQ